LRSRTLNTLPGRCPRCWIRAGFCICAEVPTLPTRTQVLVLRHVREQWKSTGTARIAQLALPNCTVVDYPEDLEGFEASLLPRLHGAALLFPDDAESTPLPAHERPVTLVVVDGTWRQTRRMVKRLPAVQSLPRLSLGTAAAPVLRLRESPSAEGRSTLEAIAEALRALEGEATAHALEQLHALMVERVFRARGVWAQKSAPAVP
jgi:DTW domain-containing protein YfiP